MTSLKTSNKKVKDATKKLNDVREAGEKWQVKLATMKQEMLGIAAAAYNDREPKALKRATELESDIRQAEYALAGLNARELEAENDLTAEKAKQEKTAAAAALKQVEKLYKQIGEKQQDALAHILLLAETSLQIRNLSIKAETLAGNYGIAFPSVRWNRTSRPLREWAMHVLGDAYGKLRFDTSRRAEPNYRKEIDAIMATDAGKGILKATAEANELFARPDEIKVETIAATGD